MLFLVDTQCIKPLFFNIKRLILMKLTPNLCLIIIYTVGIIGMIVIDKAAFNFIALTPLTLIVSLALVIWGERNRSNQMYIGLALASFFGWLVEAIGTNTGSIFGAYDYGPTLGWHIWRTPFTMAINWASLIYCTTLIVKEIPLKPQFQRLMIACIGAILMVFLDFFLEPVAIKYDFWTWKENSDNLFLIAPWQNYTSWWIISFLFIYLLYPFFKNCENKSAWMLYTVQLIFFIVINFI